MRLIILGPPGSGKGTQAVLLSQRLGMVHISTGDILRHAIRNQTPEGKLAQPYIARGQLVPDEVVNQIIAARFRGPSRPEDFILDGYPRTDHQADALDEVLKEQGIALDGVILLEVDDQEIIRRVGGRWICPNPSCLATYNTFNKKSKKPGICDACGTGLIQRDDDKEETIRHRLEVYHTVIDELVHHYEAQGLLIRVHGKGDIESIRRDLELKLLGKDHK